MTPPKITDVQIEELTTNAVRGYLEERNDDPESELAYAIADLRDQQWQEMLAGQEPVAWVVTKPGGYHDVGYHSDVLNKIPSGTKLFTHPAPDHTAVMRQALIDLQWARINIESWGAYASDYFQKKHDLIGDLVAADNAIAALKQALGEKT